MNNLDLDILRVRCILNIQVGMSSRRSEGQATDMHLGFFNLQLVLKAKRYGRFIENMWG